METPKKNGSFTDLVFENRNKEYGAYVLRKSYDDHLTKAMLIALGFVLCLITLSRIDFGKKTMIVTDDVTPYVFRKIDNTVFKKRDEIKPNGGEKKPVPKSNNAKPVVTDSVITRKADTIKVVNGNPNGDPRLPKDSLPTIGGGGPTGPTGPTGPKEIVATPDKNPQFPGGDEAMYKFIQKYLRYPEEAKIAEKQGKVYVNFIVSETGKIMDIKTKNKLGFGLDEAAMRVVKLMPDWEPGIYKGEPVPVSFMLPIVFKYFK